MWESHRRAYTEVNSILLLENSLHFVHQHVKNKNQTRNNKFVPHCILCRTVRHVKSNLTVSCHNKMIKCDYIKFIERENL